MTARQLNLLKHVLSNLTDALTDLHELSQNYSIPDSDPHFSELAGSIIASGDDLADLIDEAVSQ